MRSAASTLQFYSEFEFSKTVIEVQSGRHLFAASGKTPTKQGWKVLFTSDSEVTRREEGEDVDALIEQGLPRVSQENPALLKGADLANKMTARPAFSPKPPSCRNGEHRQIRDRGEVQTDPQNTRQAKTPQPPARASSGGAVDKGYFKRQKKVLIATEGPCARGTTTSDQVTWDDGRLGAGTEKSPLAPGTCLFS